MGLFSFVGSLLGGGSAKKASRRAERAMVDAYNRGIDTQNQQFQQTREDFEPYRQAGVTGLGQLGDLVGIGGGEKQNAAIEALKASPFYQQLFGAGEEALLQTAAATGGLRGGNTQGALADFGRDTLMATIERQLASLGGLAGMGMGATESVANFGQQRANNVTGLLGQIGGAKASGALTRGGINAQMWNNAGAFADQAAAAAAGAFMPGAGAGGGAGGFLSSLFKGGF